MNGEVDLTIYRYKHYDQQRKLDKVVSVSNLIGDYGVDSCDFDVMAERINLKGLRTRTRYSEIQRDVNEL